MRRQAELICGHHSDEVRAYWTDEKLDEIFGSAPPGDKGTAQRG